MTSSQPTKALASMAASTWSPFRFTIFAVVWAATVVSNVGGWMYSAAASWLMTSLSSDPLTVSLVQVANNLPVLLLALPAGALADIMDKRKFLIVGETATALLSTLFAALVWLGRVGPSTLLLFVFLIGAAGALTAPAWQAVVPDLVPDEQLSPALALNSLGVNVSRAIGSALGGVLIAGFGIAAPFWANAVSNAGVIGSLLWWRPAPKPARRVPVEQFYAAMRTGFRHARNNPRLRATLGRAAAFYLFASAYWALLPLVARNQIDGGPALYGTLLAAIGIGAILGAMQLRWLRKRIGTDKAVAAGSLGTAITIALYAVAHGPLLALLASLLAGASWITVLASLNLAAQLALPDWVRGRGLGIYVMVFFGALTVGSALWGQLAGWLGLVTTHWIAAAGMLPTIPLMWVWKLQKGHAVNLTPSLHWPAPLAWQNAESSDGPVLVTVEYHVADEKRQAFLLAIDRLSHERKRDGGYGWALYEDSTLRGRFLETFNNSSWMEHLRQHERVTRADQALQSDIRQLVEHDAVVSHFIATHTGATTMDNWRVSTPAG